MPRKLDTSVVFSFVGVFIAQKFIPFIIYLFSLELVLVACGGRKRLIV